jgi:hypothetical protein
MIGKTRAITFSRKTNEVIFHCKISQSSINPTDSIKDVIVFINSKLFFHDYILSQYIKMLGIVRAMTISWSRVSSGSIVCDYGLDDRAIGVLSPAGAKDFSSILCVQTGSGAHPASCPMGTGGPFPGA